MINWQQYGLKKDPYDTLPLVEGGDIPIEQAFIGRENEKNSLNQLFENENNICLTLCGDVGVGKTSLTNFQKFIWKYQKSKLLFSSRREIEANEELLNKKNFLLEILSSLIREIELLNPELLKKEPLSKIRQLIEVTQTMSISGGISYPLVGGIDFGTTKNISLPPQITNVMLESYFNDFIAFIKNNEINGLKYSGIIIHVNNFDVVLANKKENEVIKFFNEIRDVLQTKHVYYVFLGPKNFYREIIAKEKRVKGIFISTPLILKPLSKSEIVQALEERMRLLQSEHVKQYIKPVADEIVFALYDIFNGDIRLIMTALRDIVAQSSDRASKTLTFDEGKYMLAKHRWEKILSTAGLTDDQVKLLLEHIVESEDFVSQRDIALKTKKAQSNISGYYFKPFKQAGIIEEKGKKGKTVYWGLTPECMPLKWLKDSGKKVANTIEQTSMFEKL